MTAESQAPDSKFAFVVVAARRARQLMMGASPLVANPRSHKSTRVAIEELGAGVLEYQLPEIPGDLLDKDGKRRKEERAETFMRVALGVSGGVAASKAAGRGR